MEAATLEQKTMPLAQIVEDPNLSPEWPLLAVSRSVGGACVDRGMLVAGGGPTVFKLTVEEAHRLGAEPEVLQARTWAGAFKLRFQYETYDSWDALAAAGWTL
jgi:hypothetical protein